MSKKRKSYSKQFKIDAVKLITEQGYKPTEAARNLGINHQMLRRWKTELEKKDSDAFPGNEKVVSEQEELIRLRKENAQLRMERDILKKAAVFFAKETE